MRVDLIGAISILGDDAGRALADNPDGGARDVRLRIAAMHDDRAQAERLGQEYLRPRRRRWRAHCAHTAPEYDLLFAAA